MSYVAEIGGMNNSITFDVSTVDIKKCKIGDRIEVTITGKIVSLEAPPPDMPKGLDKPHMRVDIKSQKLRKLDGPQKEGIKELAEDKDEEN